MTEFSRIDAEHDQEQFYRVPPTALHGSPQIQCLSGQATVGSLFAVEKDTNKVIIIKIRVNEGLSRVRSAFSRQIFPVPIITVSISFRFVSYPTILSYLIREPRINGLEDREHSTRHSIRYC